MPLGVHSWSTSNLYCTVCVLAMMNSARAMYSQLYTHLKWVQDSINYSDGELAPDLGKFIKTCQSFHFWNRPGQLTPTFIAECSTCFTRGCHFKQIWNLKLNHQTHDAQTSAFIQKCCSQISFKCSNKTKVTFLYKAQDDGCHNWELIAS